MGDSLKDLLGANVVGKDGNPVDVESLKSCQLVGVYFSAHWCPPCRGFTPALASCYTEINAEEKKFEVVFVSLDRGDDDFKSYYNEMPWLTIKFDDSETKDKLKSLYGVSGIPCLVLLKPSGEMATKEGRGKVGEGAASFPWGLV